MKSYVYKIQWLLGMRMTFANNETTADKLSRLRVLLDVLGVRSLDKICLRDRDYKIVDTYTNFIGFPSGVAEAETMKYIKKQLKENDKIHYVELLKK